MTAPQYRFQFQIIDDEIGDTIIADYTSLGTIDEFGGNEEIESLVARMLRMFKRSVRAEYERKNYPADEEAETV